MAGLIVFGKAPRVEVPPAPSELTLPMGIESTIDPENTDPGGGSNWDWRRSRRTRRGEW